MSKTRTLEELKALREEAQEKMVQMQNRQKVLLNKETDAKRRLRTRQLIQRGAMLESIFPELMHCSNENVMAFLADVARLPDVNHLLEKATSDPQQGA